MSLILFLLFSRSMLSGRLCLILGLLGLASQLNLMPSLGFHVSTSSPTQPRSPFGQIPSPTPQILPPTTASTSSSTPHPPPSNASSQCSQATVSTTPTASITLSTSSSSISSIHRCHSLYSSIAMEICRFIVCPLLLLRSQHRRIPTCRLRSTVSVGLFSNRAAEHIKKQCYFEQFEDYLNCRPQG